MRTLSVAMPLLAASIASLSAPLLAQREARVTLSEFVYNSAPFASAHASNIEETGGVLVAAWFGGSSEGAADVGIWVSRRVDGKWTVPVEVANGMQPDGERFPCWNPVLFKPKTGPLTLYYKVGPSPREWWGEVRSSGDAGATWSGARKFPAGILGPIKNKPVQLTNGAIVSPSSTESADTPPRWRIHFERSSDRGATWSTVAPPDAPDINAIQPTIFVQPSGKLQALVRTQSSKIFETSSADSGATWSPLAATELPNPNAGIDGVTLRDGLVHITYTWKRRRIKHVVIDPGS